jgi:hypothetical protein
VFKALLFVLPLLSLWIIVRVNRLAKFSPFGLFLFTVDRFKKVTEVAQIIGVLFPQLKLCTDISRNRLGYVLGDFFYKLIWSP